MYAFTENFVLPLSHDEVVHGKASLLGKMPGDNWQRFANLRALFTYQWAYPGKKLLFMGGELAQPTEWADSGSLIWELEKQDSHRGVQRLVRDLNNVYRAFAPLHEQDVQPQGFEWLSHDDAAQSVVAFSRYALDGSSVLVFCNFTPVPRMAYRVGVPETGKWREIINSDNRVYGGSGLGNGVLATEPVATHARPQSLVVDLPPLACVIFART